MDSELILWVTFLADYAVVPPEQEAESLRIPFEFRRRDKSHLAGFANVTYLLRGEGDALDTWHGRYLDGYEKRGVGRRILERVCVHECTTSAPVSPMEIDALKFRQGSFDRPSSNRRLGP